MAPIIEGLRAIAQNTLLGLGPLRRVAARKHVTGIDGDEELARGLFEFYRQHGDVAGKAILELGPGKTLETLELARDAGAERTAAVDVLRYHDDAQALARRIDYHVYDGHRLPFDTASFDLVWACYCMQHFRYPEETAREIARVLRPRGRLICRVDLRDHYHMFTPGRQYDCLRHSDRVWRFMAWNRGSYVNRLRCSEWLALLADADLPAVEVIPHRDPELLAQNREHAYLRPYSDEDLLTYRFDGVFEKAAA